MSSEPSAAAGRIAGLAGVLIWTADFEPMLRFYRDTLGMAPRHVKPDFVNFDWNGIRLSISVHTGVHGRARDPLRQMVNLVAEDLDALHDRLSAAGVKFIRPPEREDFGGRVATFEDPDGNLLQLLELPRDDMPR